MPRDAVSRTANVGTVGKNGLNSAIAEAMIGRQDVMQSFLRPPILRHALHSYDDLHGNLHGSVQRF